MKICFSQPAFIPWGGFFARLLFADLMVLLDDTFLAQGFTFVNRNRIKGPDGEIWLTVPLQRKGRGRQKIKDLEIFEKERWGRKFLLTIRHFYRKSIFFEPLFSQIAQIINDPDENFFPLTLNLIKLLQNAWKIDTPLVLQSELKVTGKGTELLVKLARKLQAEEVILSHFAQKKIDFNQFISAGIKVNLHRFQPLPYPQFWGEFCPNLSALDLYLCLGPAGKTLLTKSSYLKLVD
ncbi:MAG TPA: hypothetical protein ENF17_03345 [Candidatus Aminicenantes bacterium]|nr:hypothetical protein [Candidatus Aminicenantes bacterium]